MRASAFCFLACAVALWTSIASAGVPDPALSSVVVTGQGSPCQFRFRSNGGMDVMTVRVTVRSVFGPVISCSTSVTVTPTNTTLALCSCDGLRRGRYTDADGALEVTFARLGGRGSCEVRVTASCSGQIELARLPFTFTTADLDGSCATSNAVNVVDLGIWAAGLPPDYEVQSDYDCNGAVNVVDLGTWAGGLGVGCASP